MLRISYIIGPFALAIAGLMFLQTGPFYSGKTALEAETSEPVLHLTDVADVIARAPMAGQGVAPQAHVTSVSPENEEIHALTNLVLAGLGAQPSAPIEVIEVSDEMRDLTSHVLAGLTIQTAQPSTPAPEASEESSLSEIVTQAMAAGQSENLIDTLLNDAFLKGLISVPPALQTSDGRVDTAILIAELERAARGQAPTIPTDDVIAGGAGVEVRVVQEAGRTVHHNFYTVQKGDSLGAIAHKFYGDAGKFANIFDANRRLLSSPNRIKAGQRLSIPPLSRI